MSDAWIAAFALLALLSLTSAVLLVAVMRQVGILHQQLDAAGLPENRPRAGSLVERIEYTAVPGSIDIDPFHAPVTIFAYVQPGCGGCEEVPQLIHTASERGHPDGVQVVLATQARDEAAHDYLVKHGIELPFIRSEGFADHFGISGTPYLVAVGHEGERLRIIAGAIPREPEDLLELIRYAQERDEQHSQGPDAEPMLGVDYRRSNLTPAAVDE